MDGQAHEWTNRLADGGTNSCTDKWIDGQMKGQTDRQTDRRTDGQQIK